jgi:enoyl-CoA hydratase
MAPANVSGEASPSSTTTIESSGLMNTQRRATIFDGIARHSPEGTNFKARVEAVGWKQAVRERDLGAYDWTQDRPFRPT